MFLEYFHIGPIKLYIVRKNIGHMESMINDMVVVGFRRSEAKVLLFLEHNTPAVNNAIVCATGLSGATVSSVLTKLRASGVVSSERHQTGARRGRPETTWTLQYRLPAILADVEAEKKANVARELSLVYKLSRQLRV